MIGVVEIGRVGMENEVGAAILALCQVVFEVAGIGREIRLAIKLERVDEDGDENGARGADLGAGLVDESEMAFMEGSHGGDESERGRPVSSCGKEIRNGGEGIHR